MYSAKIGLSQAEYSIGVMYLSGDGVAKDERLGLEWIEKSANQNDSDACYELAVIYRFRPSFVNESAAFYWFTKAAKQNHPAALCHLGLMYDKGIGVQRDVLKAIELYKQASDLGIVYAQTNLSEIYYIGDDGVKRDVREALIWFKKAADLGDTQSQYKIGSIYFLGDDGVDKDVNQALEWFQKAANLGSITSQYKLGEIYYQGTDVTRNLQIALDWFFACVESSEKVKWFT